MWEMFTLCQGFGVWVKMVLYILRMETVDQSPKQFTFTVQFLDYLALFKYHVNVAFTSIIYLHLL